MHRQRDNPALQFFENKSQIGLDEKNAL